MILAIDTATQYASLALSRVDAVFAEETWFSGRNHTVELAPRIERLLKLANLQVADLTALAVTLGPGSFTGVRIGLAMAKGLALPYRLPVVGIPTLEITAYPFKTNGLPVWAIAAAGRGRILAACYSTIDEQWQAFDHPRLTTVEALAAQIDAPVLCAGELDEAAAQTLQRQTDHKAQVVSPAARLRRAGYLAEIAAQRLEIGAQDDPDALVPIYVSTP